MAHILGTTDPMPKWQAVSLVWDYIHNNHLQDAQDPRKIYPDSAVLNITPVECRDNKYITMSDLTDYINKHLAPNDGTKVGGKF
jgi:chromatin remodeling complex protein RSC6